ncbi:MAG: hypothetical protein EAZ92_10730 [Candidatus Kapaibacterium sp.]|nr:MAG: hypothetical protein EAZ92_10730 [Candidatus Kapabacteria bacterium]
MSLAEILHKNSEISGFFYFLQKKSMKCISFCKNECSVQLFSERVHLPSKHKQRKKIFHKSPRERLDT